MLNRKKKTIVAILLAVYSLILIWMILLKGSVHTLQVLFLSEFRSINFLPAFNARETLLNFLAFVPLGLYLGMLRMRSNDPYAWLKPLLIVLLCSLFLEISQYILALGTADITDLISNTLGGFAGLVSYHVLRKAFGGNANRIIIIFATIATALLLTFVVARDIWPEALELGRRIVD